MIDADTLHSSENYDELPETYVIFITENDILRQNKPLYVIDRTINGTPDKFDDGSHILYVNSQIQDDTKLGKLMRDFACVDPDRYSYKVLSDRAGYFKNSKEGLQTMCRIVEEIVEKEVAAAKNDTKREAALNMLKSTDLSPEKNSQILNIDKNIVDELSKQVRH